MAWFALIMAGALEIVWALALKYSQGFTRFWPSAITVLAVIFSFICLGLSLKTVPFGTAYAIWTGVGAAGAIIARMGLFGEPTDGVGCWSPPFVRAGVVGVHMLSPACSPFF